MFTLAFWKATAERALKTFAQSLLGVLSVAVGAATGFAGLDWGNVLQAAGVAALASVLTSLISAPVGGSGPSLAGETLADKATVTVPADAPVVVEFDGQGGDTKADAAYHGKHE